MIRRLLNHITRQHLFYSSEQQWCSTVTFLPSPLLASCAPLTGPLLITPHWLTSRVPASSYVNTRLTTVIPNEWKNWISDGSAIGYNLSALNSSSFPKIGIAISGGGYRAAQYGAGVLSALDARNQSGKAAGTGGLLQVSSYLSGLSGASRFLLSINYRELWVNSCLIDMNLGPRNECIY
jgi:hypothetical protein